MNTKRWIVVSVCAVVALLSFWANKLFPAETHGVLWHVRHGFHIEAHSMAFRVPLFYDADREEGGLKMSRDVIEDRWRFVGPPRGKYGLILMLFASGESLNTLPQGWNKSGALAGPRKMDLLKTAERSMRLARREGTCIEYNRPPLVVNGSERRDNVEVDCWFGDDVLTSFQGNRDSVQDFYDVLQSARPVEVKH